MKFFVCVALLLLAVDHAESCRLEMAQDLDAEGHLLSKGCRDESNGILRENGESWMTSDCNSCSCSKGVIGCCVVYSTPRKYPDDCVAVFEQQNCRYSVHKKNDPSVECPVWAAVMK